MKKICFALLVHENRNEIIKIVENIRFYCPNSSVVLFNGGSDENLCKGLDIPVCPSSKQLGWGNLVPYFIEVMKWLESIDFDYQYLINLDSDCLFAKKGYEEFVVGAMEDVDYMAVNLRLAEKHWYPGQTFRKEQHKWGKVFTIEPLYGIFNVGQVFSRDFIRGILNFSKLPLLQRLVDETNVFALEELVFVNLAKDLGYPFKSYSWVFNDIIRYRPYFSFNEIITKGKNDQFGYLLHPIRREKEDGARTFIYDVIMTKIQEEFRERNYLSGFIKDFDVNDQSVFFLSDLGLNTGPNEILAVHKSGKLVNWRRLSDQLPWFGPYFFGESAPEATALLRSHTGHLEAIVRHEGRLAHYWREEPSSVSWHLSTFFATDCIGKPLYADCPIGNFEVVSGLVNGGLGYWWRDNHDPHKPWYGPELIDNKGYVKPLSILRNDENWLVVVAISEGKLVYYKRKPGTSHWILVN